MNIPSKGLSCFEKQCDTGSTEMLPVKKDIGRSIEYSQVIKTEGGI